MDAALKSMGGGHPGPAPGRAPSPGAEIKFAGAPLPAATASGAFEGYASLFDTKDLGGDIVLPGAFRESLARRGLGGVKLLWQHNPSEPIGVWTSIAEDARGLFVRGRLDVEVARAREVLSLLRSRAVDGLSIGFRTVRSRRDAATGLRSLQTIDLWEISIVTFPMQPAARVSAVKRAPFPPFRTTDDPDVRTLAAIRQATAVLRG